MVCTLCHLQTVIDIFQRFSLNAVGNAMNWRSLPKKYFPFQKHFPCIIDKPNMWSTRHFLVSFKGANELESRPDY